MAFAKRVFLFLVLNFAVIITIAFLLRLFNVQPFLTDMGINYFHLLLFCLIWGMGGAFISLLLSKYMAKWMMGVKIIDPESIKEKERFLLRTVEELARRANLSSTPEVGIYEGKEVNAFATGPTQRHCLVAVSTGLLDHMNTEEVEGVLGHEISHIKNGDMVTMTLLQGVVNAFVIFLARILAIAFSGLGRGRGRSSYGTYYMFVFLFEVVFMILGSLVVASYSRFREYRADKGGASVAGRHKMIHALESLSSMQNIKDSKCEKAAFQSFKISSPKKRGLLFLFSTHPPIEERIERLKKML